MLQVLPQNCTPVWAIASLSFSVIWKSPPCSSDQLRCWRWFQRFIEFTGKGFPIWPTWLGVHRQMGGGRKNTYCSRCFLGWHRFLGVSIQVLWMTAAWQSLDFLPVETWQAGFLDVEANRHSKTISISEEIITKKLTSLNLWVQRFWMSATWNSYWITRWWFQILFIFTPIWGRCPIWLIFFRWVETTNQISWRCFELWTIVCWS